MTRVAAELDIEFQPSDDYQARVNLVNAAATKLAATLYPWSEQRVTVKVLMDAEVQE